MSSGIYKFCVDCGAEKAHNYKKRCLPCGQAANAAKQRKIVYYDTCATCHNPKPRTRRQDCKRCAGLKGAIKAGFTGNTYVACELCGQDKARNTSRRCRPCAARLGVIGRNTGTWRHDAEGGYNRNPVEVARRQREAFQCARILRARIAARFRRGVPMNVATLREMFAPDREEGEAA